MENSKTLHAEGLGRREVAQFMKEDDGAEDDDETDGSQQRALCPAASANLQERQKASSF